MQWTHRAGTVEKTNRGDAILVFYSLKFTGNGVKRLFPRYRLKFTAAPFPYPFQGSFQAVAGVGHFLLGKSSGTRLQARHWAFIGTDMGNLTVGYIDLEETARTAVVITAGGHHFVWGI
jgi:hypothetical protein